MPDLTVAALHTFAAHHHVATHQMLESAGIGRHRRQRLVRNGVLIPATERVVRLAGSPRTLEQRCAELCLTHAGAFVTGPTLAQMMDLRRVGRPSLLHLSVPHGKNVGPIPGVRLRQSTKIAPWHVVERVDGIRLASAARLAFDLSHDLPPDDHASVVEQLIQRHGLTPEQLRRVGAELVHPLRPGSRQFVAMLEHRLGGGAAESHGEVAIAAGLAARGVPVVRQHQLVLPDGRRIRLDLAVPSVRWAVEIDGFSDHFGVHGGTKDRRRDRACHALGWQIERVTSIDLADVEGTCDELAGLFERRRLEVA